MKTVIALAAALLLAVACGQDSPSPPDRPSAGFPTSSESEVLTRSEREVSPGQVVEVSFEPPPEHDVWGVEGELWQEQDVHWRRIAWVSAWAGKPKMSTIWPSADEGDFSAIGFGGSASWKWRIPARLEPGNYELRKEWLPKAPASPDRPVVTERASFIVVAG